MEAKRKKRYLITFLILILCVIAFLLLNICIGTVQIPLSELKNAVMDGDSKLGRIVLDIRAPRSFAADGFWAERLRWPDIFCRPSSTIRLRALSYLVYRPVLRWWWRW